MGGVSIDSSPLCPHPNKGKNPFLCPDCLARWFGPIEEKMRVANLEKVEKKK